MQPIHASTMCAGSQYSKKVLHLRRAILKTQASRLGLRPHRLAWVLSTACLKCKTSTRVTLYFVKTFILYWQLLIVSPWLSHFTQNRVYCQCCLRVFADVRKMLKWLETENLYSPSQALMEKCKLKYDYTLYPLCKYEVGRTRSRWKVILPSHTEQEGWYV